jgi:hypothetical protein
MWFVLNEVDFDGEAGQASGKDKLRTRIDLCDKDS